MRASCTLRQIALPISICDCRNSGLTWSPIWRMRSSCSNCWTTAANSPVAGSISWYSSSMPMVKGAVYMVVSLSQGVVSEKDINIILQHGKRAWEKRACARQMGDPMGSPYGRCGQLTPPPAPIPPFLWRASDESGRGARHCVMPGIFRGRWLCRACGLWALRVWRRMAGGEAGIERGLGGDSWATRWVAPATTKVVTPAARGGLRSDRPRHRTAGSCCGRARFRRRCGR